MAKFFGLEFAPILIPFERRLQTLAVFYYCSEFLLIGFLTFFTLIGLLFTQFYFISLLYFSWFVYDRNVCNQGGRINYWTRNWSIWRHYANYFPLKLVKTVDLDPNKNYIFGCHPHGIMCASHFGNFATEGTGFSKIFPGITPHILTLEGQFWLPLHRELFIMTGACAATKKSMEWILSKEGKGQACILIVGGAIEALDAVPNTMELTLKNRKGFVKLALRNGASLVPVISLGENDIFVQKPNTEKTLLRKVQEYATQFLGFSPPMFHGRGVFQYSIGYVPYRKPIITIVGKPIDVTKVDNPSNEQINELHDKYVESLNDLFETSKQKYGYKDLDLKIK